MIGSMHCPLRHLVTWVLAGIALCAGVRAQVLSAAGDASHGFVATKTKPIGGPMHLLPGAGKRSVESNEIGTIYHLPGALEAGTIRHGPDMPWAPSAMATRDGRVVMVFEPESPVGDQPSAWSASRRVRAITVRAGAVDGTFFYEPMGRDPEALASLPAEGAVRGLAMGAWGPVALLAGADGADGARLLALRGVEWESVPLPAGVERHARLDLTTREGRPTLVAESGGMGATAWTLASADGREGTWEWGREPIAPPRADERVIGVGTGLVGWSRDAEGQVRLRLLRESGAYDLAPVTGVSERFGIVPGDQRVSVVWLSREQRENVEREIYRVAVVSTVTGKVLYEGPARTGTSLTGRDLQTLALLAGALLLTALVFVLRPSPDETGAVALPSGTALAETWRRAAGLLIDLAPGMALAALVFGVSMEELASAAALATTASAKPVMALLVGVMLTATHEILGEWLTGRSLGKWATGCRVVTTRGTKLALWQAVVRTALKLFCPPLALFVLIDPRRRHPADILARTVVVMRAPEPRGPEGPEGR